MNLFSVIKSDLAKSMVNLHDLRIVASNRNGWSELFIIKSETLCFKSVYYLIHIVFGNS